MYFKRALSSCLCLVFLFSQTVFAYNPEKSFWEQRRKAKQQPQTNSPVLAQLTSAAPLNQSLSVPHLSQPQIPSIVQNLKKTAPKKSQQELNKLSQLVSGLSAHGAVQNIHIPKKTSKDNPTVIYIQDVHGQFEAQKNIGEMILNVLKLHPDAVVGLEGTAGHIPIKSFRNPSNEVNKEVGSFFLKAGLISGPEYAGLAAKETPHLFGIEDAELYLDNVDSLKLALSKQKETIEKVQAHQRQLQLQKPMVYSKELLELDQQWRNYRNGTLSVGPYLTHLSSIKTNLTDFPVLSLFLETWHLEKQMNFGQAEKERNQFFSHLSEKLEKKELERLLEKTVALRSGAMTYPDYYRSLQNMAQKAALSLSKTPEFDRYVKYVLKADSLKPSLLLSELRKYEKEIWDQLCKTSEQKVLHQTDVKAYLGEKLVRLTLTPADWTEYKKNREGSDYRWFESFYEMAQARDVAFTQNLKEKLNESSAKVSVIVAGGFHSEGLNEFLQKENLTLITVTPKLTKLNHSKHNDYLHVFTRDKTPLEKLFESPKISIIRTSPFKALKRESSQGVFSFNPAKVQAFGPIYTQYKNGQLSAKQMGEAIHKFANGNEKQMLDLQVEIGWMYQDNNGDYRATSDHPWANEGAKILSHKEMRSAVWKEQLNALRFLLPAALGLVAGQLFQFGLATQLGLGFVGGVISLLFYSRKKIREWHIQIHNEQGLREVDLAFVGISLASLFLALSTHGFLKAEVGLFVFVLALFVGMAAYNFGHWQMNKRAIQNPAVAPGAEHKSESGITQRLETLINTFKDPKEGNPPLGVLFDMLMEDELVEKEEVIDHISRELYPHLEPAEQAELSRLIAGPIASEVPLKLTRKEKSQTKLINKMAYSPKGRYLAYSDGWHKVIIRDRSKGGKKKGSEIALDYFFQEPYKIEFSADGRFLAVQDTDELHLFQMTGQQAKRITVRALGDTRQISDVTFSPDLPLMAVWGGREGDYFIRIYIIEGETFIRLSTPELENLPTASWFHFGPNGLLAASYWDFINLHQVRGEEVSRLSGPGTESLQGEYNVAFSPDGRLLAVIEPHYEEGGILSSNIYTVRLYELQEDRISRLVVPELESIEGGDQIAFSQDGRLLAVSQGRYRFKGADRTLLFYQIKGTNITRLKEPALIDLAGINQIVFSQDKRELGVGTDDSLIRVRLSHLFKNGEGLPANGGDFWKEVRLVALALIPVGLLSGVVAFGLSSTGSVLGYVVLGVFLFVGHVSAWLWAFALLDKFHQYHFERILSQEEKYRKEFPFPPLRLKTLRNALLELESSEAAGASGPHLYDKYKALKNRMTINENVADFLWGLTKRYWVFVLSTILALDFATFYASQIFLLGDSTTFYIFLIIGISVGVLLLGAVVNAMVHGLNNILPFEIKLFIFFGPKIFGRWRGRVPANSYSEPHLFNNVAERKYDITEQVDENENFYTSKGIELLNTLRSKKALSQKQRQQVGIFLQHLNGDIQENLLEAGTDFRLVSDRVNKRLQGQLGVAQTNWKKGRIPTKEISNAVFLSGFAGIEQQVAVPALGLLGQMLGVDKTKPVLDALWNEGKKEYAALIKKLAVRPYYAPSLFARTQRLETHVKPSLHADVLIDPLYSGTDEEAQTIEQLREAIRSYKPKSSKPLDLVIRPIEVIQNPNDPNEFKEKARAAHNALVGRLMSIVADDETLKDKLPYVFNFDFSRNEDSQREPTKGLILVQRPGLLKASDILIHSLKARGIKGEDFFAAINSTKLSLYTALPHEVTKTDWKFVFLILKGMKILPFLQLKTQEAEKARIYSSHA